MTLSIPRDRAGTFDPKLIAKYQRRLNEAAFAALRSGRTERLLSERIAGSQPNPLDRSFQWLRSALFAAA
jgi:hypothetical protein